MCQAMLYTLNSFSESSGGNVNFGSLSEGCKAMLSETVGWQQRIKRTIAGDAFTLVYQPIVDLSDGQAHHYAVLTRLNDDPKTSPYKFITMAEQLGKIAEFDWAVMERVFKVLRSFGVDHGQGYHFGKPIPQLPWEQEVDKAAAAPSHHQGWDPTVRRRAKAG